MVTAGIFPFKENSHSRAGNRTRDIMISSQRLWPLDHEAGQSKYLKIVKIITHKYNYYPKEFGQSRAQKPSSVQSTAMRVLCSKVFTKGTVKLEEQG